MSAQALTASLNLRLVDRPSKYQGSLSFEDETPEKRSPGARYQSPLPDELGEMTDSDTISQQLMILSKLRFRKLFLVLSYIGRQKLEAVVNLDAANEIYGMKNLPMKDFEAKIWNSYGKKFCEESDRSQPLNWFPSFRREFKDDNLVHSLHFAIEKSSIVSKRLVLQERDLLHIDCSIRNSITYMLTEG
ncbi:UNVERIFIED_CONTAM: hypothetical protein Scaly_2011400, partial [Sesamum calycinum]